MDQGEHGVHSVDAQLLAFEGLTIVPPPPEPAAPEGGADPWNTMEPSGLNGSRLIGLSPSQCANMPIPPYIIKVLLAKGQVGVVAALPASGKSCFIPLLAYRLAQGHTVFGRRTRPGRVAYFGLEDERGTAGRIDALRLKYGDAPDFRLFVRARNLLTCPEEREEIKRIIRVGRPDLVIFDTLRAGWAGLAENDSDQMGQVVAYARELTTRDDGEPGPSVINVHHPTKAGGQTASGSGVLEADADVTLFLAKDLETNIVTVTMGKNRNGESFGQEMCFGFESVRIGTDQDGDPVTRPVAVEVDPRTVKRTKALSPTQSKALAILEELIAVGGEDVQHNPTDMMWAGVPATAPTSKRGCLKLRNPPQPSSRTSPPRQAGAPARSPGTPRVAPRSMSEFSPRLPAPTWTPARAPVRHLAPRAPQVAGGRGGDFTRLATPLLRRLRPKFFDRDRVEATIEVTNYAG